MSITTVEELGGMRAVGAVVRRTIDAMAAHVAPGVTTGELDAIGSGVMKQHGARSAPALVYGFPGANCISVNDEAVHGVPGSRRLRDGDIVTLDVTVEKDGFMADAAVTLTVGDVSRDTRRLVSCAERGFRKAMGVVRAGVRVREVGRAVEREVRQAGFSVIRELGGHGIGRTIHEDPHVPNYADPFARAVLTDGMVITVEPIIALGSAKVVVADDGWTVRTADGLPSAHYEHTLVVTNGAPILLTAA